MTDYALRFLVVAALAAFLNGCATQQAPPAQTQAFGQPESTIPWNQPQSWEGGGGGLNALRGGDEGR